LNLFDRTSISLFLALFFFSVNAQKNKDPFARSARLPDISIGVGFNQNTLEKYRVPGGSLVFNTMYFDFNRRFLVGIDFTQNINNHSSTVFIPTQNQEIRDVGNFKRLIYNSTIFSVRGGFIFNEKLFVVIATGIEKLDEFKEYNASDSVSDLSVFHEETGDRFSLFYSKFGLMYRFDKFISEFFYSKRGLGIGVNYFFGD
tara:strand:- start:2024 stop:2626 length:603 start_codon:yes stop_codon:yes gene_type:complete